MKIVFVLRNVNMSILAGHLISYLNHSKNCFLLLFRSPRYKLSCNGESLKLRYPHKIINKIDQKQQLSKKQFNTRKKYVNFVGIPQSLKSPD